MYRPPFVARIEKRFRRERFQLLATLLETLPRPVRILDIGGTFGFWEALEYTQLGEIQVTLVNLFAEDKLPKGFQSKLGNACSLEEFSPDDFDVVMSNSVIGHVGSFEDQQNMADEIRRLGKRFFVQTPNHYFPIDWRTLVPLFHFLPLNFRAQLLHRFPIASFGRFATYADARKWAAGVRNLTNRELIALFPEATIVREYVFGLTKSFMVFQGFHYVAPRV
jgi:hypothetical protein